MEYFLQHLGKHSTTDLSLLSADSTLFLATMTIFIRYFYLVLLPPSGKAEGSFLPMGGVFLDVTQGPCPCTKLETRMWIDYWKFGIQWVGDGEER
jgi:hypothetical protein